MRADASSAARNGSPVGLDEETLVALAGAISAFLGTKAAIRRLKLVSNHGGAWALHGRTLQQLSRALRSDRIC